LKLLDATISGSTFHLSLALIPTVTDCTSGEVSYMYVTIFEVKKCISPTLTLARWDDVFDDDLINTTMPGNADLDVIHLVGGTV
jgi:hypothetical protein